MFQALETRLLHPNNHLCLATTHCSDFYGTNSREGYIDKLLLLNTFLRLHMHVLDVLGHDCFGFWTSRLIGFPCHLSVLVEIMQEACPVQNTGK